MKIVVDAVSKGHDGIPLPTTTLAFETGHVTVAVAETGDRPTVLALVASGRMVPDTGSVTLDGIADAALVRERIALVDAPDVSDPAADLLLRSVVKEELMYAGRSTARDTVDDVIAAAGGSRYASVRMGDVPPPCACACSPSWPRSGAGCRGSSSRAPTGTAATRANG